MTMDIQRLRTLTTGRLHSPVDKIYDDLREITGFSYCTHELGNACVAAKPYLKKFATDSRFWDGEYDPSHVGEIDVPPMDEAERDAFSERMSKLPNLLEGKKVVLFEM
jgi:hypothetical protein